MADIVENSLCGPFLVKKTDDGSVIIELDTADNSVIMVYDNKVRIFLSAQQAEDLGEQLFIQW